MNGLQKIDSPSARRLVLEDRNLPHSETSFECTLSLPGTAYQTSQKITYSPGKWQATRHTFGTRRFLVGVNAAFSLGHCVVLPSLVARRLI